MWNNLTLLTENDLLHGSLNPLPSGSTVLAIVNPDVFAEGQRYFLGLKSFGEAQENSDMSNVAHFMKSDSIPPNPVTDLTLERKGTFVLVQFTAPGDDYDHGQATKYELKYDMMIYDII